MKTRLLFTIGLLFGVIAFGQDDNKDGDNQPFQNSSEKLLSNDKGLSIGGYGEVHYNQGLSSETKQVGKLDVHRMVMLFAYQFNPRTQFVTELEFEHVKEVYVEQAFLQYKLNNFISLRGGLLLIPMGIVNEYHEPTTFHGVERPLVDKYIAPSTWREIGFGATGSIIDASIRYQVYLVNGFSSYNGSATLNGKNGLRKGRQKGAESFASSPNLSAKIEFFGVKGLNIGASGYFGKTQSTLYNGINKDDATSMAKADSSVVGISMLGIDARYQLKGLHLRGQYYLSSISNADQYNRFSSISGTDNDLGSSLSGYYIEGAYNILKLIENTETELLPFVRIEGYNTHNKVSDNATVNETYNNSVITTGITLKLAKGAVVKSDVQFIKPKSADKYAKVLNVGIGVTF